MEAFALDSIAHCCSDFCGEVVRQSKIGVGSIGCISGLSISPLRSRQDAVGGCCGRLLHAVAAEASDKAITDLNNRDANGLDAIDIANLFLANDGKVLLGLGHVLGDVRGHAFALGFLIRGALVLRTGMEDQRRDDHDREQPHAVAGDLRKERREPGEQNLDHDFGDPLLIVLSTTKPVMNDV